MRKVLLGLAVLLTLPVAAAAQDPPKVEVFGGYSYFRLPGVGIFQDSNLHGWEGSATLNFTKYFGVELDGSGHYGNLEQDPRIVPRVPQDLIPEISTSVHNYMIGPHVAGDVGRVRPFAHALIGGTTSRFSTGGFGSGSDTTLSGALGGGFDVRLTDLVSIRPVQADYILTNFGPEHQNNLRVSAGVVFTFGR